MSPKQKKIAAKAPPPNKITGADFAVLKKEKAKGRGMGLQDESIKPGKVMKARLGKAIMTIAEKAMSGAKSYKNYLKGLKKATSERRSEVIKSPEYSPSNYKGTKSYKALGIKNEDEFYKIKMKDPKFAGAVYKTAGSKKIPAAVDNRIRQLNANLRMDRINQNPKAKNMYEKGVTFGKKTRKMAGGMAKKYSVGGGADTGRVGEIKSKLAVVSDMINRKKRDGDRLTQRDIEAAREIARKDKQPRQGLKSLRQSATPGYLPKPAMKMGGGMMNKPSGYRSGVMVKCKLGRNKPTKLY